MEELTGTDHTSVCRTIKRALLRLDQLFPDGAILDHPEAVDEAAYLAWTELDTHPELIQEPVLALVRKPHPGEYHREYVNKADAAATGVTVRRAAGKRLENCWPRCWSGRAADCSGGWSGYLRP